MAEACVSPSEEELEQLLPKEIDAERLWPYAQRRNVGKGAFGTVFISRPSATASASGSRPVAVKYFARATGTKQETVRREDAAEEARLLWRMKCQCRDYLLCEAEPVLGEDDRFYYIVSEALE